MRKNPGKGVVRRGTDTACAVPGVPSPGSIRDPHAEAVLLCGLMRDPDPVLDFLTEIEFDRSHLYDITHARLYDAQLYLLNGGGTCGPFDLYTDRFVRGDNLGLDSPWSLAQFLADVWTVDSWFDDIRNWADAVGHGMSYRAFAAACAATKVVHLAERRRLAAAAIDMLREAMNPTGGAGELRRKADDLDDY